MKILEDINISLEVILLLAVGVIMLVLGAVLFPVSTGALPYYEDGLYGLLLIMFGLQVQTVGKTPVGFIKRSWPVLIPGIIIAVVGFITGFVPGIFGNIPKYLRDRHLRGWRHFTRFCRCFSERRCTGYGKHAGAGYSPIFQSALQQSIFLRS